MGHGQAIAWGMWTGVYWEPWPGVELVVEETVTFFYRNFDIIIFLLGARQ